jgi:hypothetical protein
MGGREEVSICVWNWKHFNGKVTGTEKGGGDGGR